MLLNNIISKFIINITNCIVSSINTNAPALLNKNINVSLSPTNTRYDNANTQIIIAAGKINFVSLLIKLTDFLKTDSFWSTCVIFILITIISFISLIGNKILEIYTNCTEFQAMCKINQFKYFFIF